MLHGILAVELDWRSALAVIKAIEDPVGNLDPADVDTYGSDIAEACAAEKAEEIIDYLERGELRVPAGLRERAAKAIINFRLDKSNETRPENGRRPQQLTRRP